MVNSLSPLRSRNNGQLNDLVNVSHLIRILFLFFLNSFPPITISRVYSGCRRLEIVNCKKRQMSLCTRFMINSSQERLKCKFRFMIYLENVFLLFCYPKSMPTIQIIFLRFIYIIYLIFIVQKRMMIIKSYKFICRLFFLDSFLNSFIKSFQGDIYQFYAIVHFLAKKAVEYFFIGADCECV